MFIAFEGIDRCGKTSLSLEFQKYLNTEFSDGKGGVTIDRKYGSFVWTKEPSFTTAEADRLNNLKDLSSQYKREALFFASRLGHQDYIKKHNVICDRYVWSGMAYARVFSPGCFEFLREIYQNNDLFVQPDLYIYVNANIDTCLKRDPTLNMDTMLEIWKSYELCYNNIEEIGIPILVLNNDFVMDTPEESIQCAMESLKTRFKAHLKAIHKL